MVAPKTRGEVSQQTHSQLHGRVGVGGAAGTEEYYTAMKKDPLQMHTEK